MRMLPILLISLVFTSCMKDAPLNQAFVSSEPKEINDGLILSMPQAEGIDAQKLNSIISSTYENENLWSIRSLLVFRNNKLVAETYHKNESDITTRHLIWSCTKQVMGMLTGIAVDQGLIASLDDPMSAYLPEILTKHPDKADITIEQLITMRSGIDYSNDGVGGETDKILREIPENITEYILDRPMIYAPGSEFFYKDGDPQLMSAVIQSAAGKPTDEWANEVLFSKIGVKNYNWVRYKDGTSLGGFGIETTPREMAKMAICVANGGSYNNQQIISNEWIDQMLSVQVDIPDSDYLFGYYWWLNTTRNIQFTWGHGGQFAFIVPDQDLIVVMTSIPNTQGDYQIQADEALPVVDQIIEACN